MHTKHGASIIGISTEIIFFENFTATQYRTVCSEQTHDLHLEVALVLHLALPWVTDK